MCRPVCSFLQLVNVLKIFVMIAKMMEVTQAGSSHYVLALVEFMVGDSDSLRTITDVDVLGSTITDRLTTRGHTRINPAAADIAFASLCTVPPELNAGVVMIILQMAVLLANVPIV